MTKKMLVQNMYEALNAVNHAYIDLFLNCRDNDENFDMLLPEEFTTAIYEMDKAIRQFDENAFYVEENEFDSEAEDILI